MIQFNTDFRVSLYSCSQVRGFSPVTAGNVRIEGVYVDRQGAIATRLVDGSTVCVGLTAQGYPFPAPTGIVDYRLRKPGDEAVVSVLGGMFAYSAPWIEVDAQFPIVAGRFGVAAGASAAHENIMMVPMRSTSARRLSPRWRPIDDIEIIPFASATWGFDEEAAPLIQTASNIRPARAPRRRYFGQDWTAKDSMSQNHGVIGKARIGRDWAVSAGVFRSSFTNRENFASRFLDTTANGRTREQVIADPEQRYASTSGELRVSRSIAEGPWLHVLHASVRARALDSRHGGSAPALNLGMRQLGELVVFADLQVSRSASEHRTRCVRRRSAWHMKDAGRASGRRALGFSAPITARRLRSPTCPGRPRATGRDCSTRRRRC